MRKIAKVGNYDLFATDEFAAELSAARADLELANENRAAIEARRLAAEQEGPLAIEKLEVETAAARREQARCLRRVTDHATLVPPPTRSPDLVKTLILH